MIRQAAKSLSGGWSIEGCPPPPLRTLAGLGPVCPSLSINLSESWCNPSSSPPWGRSPRTIPGSDQSHRHTHTSGHYCSASWNTRCNTKCVWKTCMLNGYYTSRTPDMSPPCCSPRLCCMAANICPLSLVGNRCERSPKWDEIWDPAPRSGVSAACLGNLIKSVNKYHQLRQVSTTLSRPFNKLCSMVSMTTPRKAARSKCKMWSM